MPSRNYQLRPMLDPEQLSQAIQQAAEPGKRPPVHLWNPDFSGDIDIRIAADGMWYHEGDPIKRLPLRALFASILKREGDDYFLVTPVEKWRITVERQVFSLNQMMELEDDGVYYLEFRNEIGEFVRLDAEHPIWFEEYGNQSVPCIEVRDGLSASLSRSVFYELVNLAQDCEGEMKVFSGGVGCSLGKVY
ncbi:DUF1285 domain-containing protein [Pseudoteredinibacter isoporae]|uniref:DUF1285 domain-containing protein n=1 Tax=Pseudoteredinibacter isoporae TaxID=570281 RepID=A0A7X0JSK9_9GAMM|nr:DUF1285 domain-containing protein [Pseudoteredinibacter isoporae]MBB6521525.1 hypothetical protein [Pseudoteredinibacter isoporae]NHO87079.1 DUF1285 domain-containing protein [Pseudoteredinibacter isoporae]NIB22826.1 DUF1285 domain-containing protein [Pseudoteredinibacter isoporae]